MKIIGRYRRKLLEGLLELGFRKRRGQTEAMKSFRYNMDGRLPEEYFVNLIRGWMSEDLASTWISRKARSARAVLTPMAQDADRKIRFKSARIGMGRIISGDPDFLIQFRNSKRRSFLEIQRVDRGRLKETNKKGECPVNMPRHRPEIEKEAVKSWKKLVLFLFNEGTKINPPEVALLVNPKKK